MTQDFNTEKNTEEKVDILINSFRSSFWIHEHQWYVRCYTKGENLYLSTSFKLHNYESIYPKLFQSTYANDNLLKLTKKIFLINHFHLVYNYQVFVYNFQSIINFGQWFQG